MKNELMITTEEMKVRMEMFGDKEIRVITIDGKDYSPVNDIANAISYATDSGNRLINRNKDLFANHIGTVKLTGPSGKGGMQDTKVLDRTGIILFCAKSGHDNKSEFVDWAVDMIHLGTELTQSVEDINNMIQVAMKSAELRIRDEITTELRSEIKAITGIQGKYSIDEVTDITGLTINKIGKILFDLKFVDMRAGGFQLNEHGLNSQMIFIDNGDVRFSESMMSICKDKSGILR